MSRIGKKPILLPKNVIAEAKENILFIKGPKGDWRTNIPLDILLHIYKDSSGTQIHVESPSNDTCAGKLQGLYRSLIFNGIKGVVESYKKTLEIHGIGYECELKENVIGLKLGTSNYVYKSIPKDLNVKVSQNTTQGNKIYYIEVSGTSKQAVGQFSSSLRILRSPDPYKQKGIRYQGEVLRKKVGKSFAGGK